ncbi:MAG: non-lysosomal glucosylceramidase [Armatimonadaceae bacterium]
MPEERVYNFGLKGQGFREGGHEGLPRYDQATFAARFPFGIVSLADSEMPLAVQVMGWSPFIPGNDIDSGLPCAFLEYQITNRTGEAVEYTFSTHMSHLAPGKARGSAGSRSRHLDSRGVYFWNTDPPNSESKGSAALVSLTHTPRIKAMWYRGGWFDSITDIWREVTTDTFTENPGNTDEDISGRNGGSLLWEGTLEPGASVVYAVAVVWHFPNVHQWYGGLPPTEPQTATEAGDDPPPAWRPFYETYLADAEIAARYVVNRYAELKAQTEAFTESLYRSTLPDAILDAIGSNLAILKSPTVLRQENGSVWAWEGCFATAGCCHGTCTHVWNYAQAIPHLFPALERTLRDQELLSSMDSAGHINFRAALPDGPATHTFHAASDGQLGGIMKLYRDWRISGDTEWLRERYSRAKRSLDWCIDQWDPERKGLLTGIHHNTYDIEFNGPDGMCSSIYIGALTAMAEMAVGLGRDNDDTVYRDLSGRGAAAYTEELFNGEYLVQRPADPEAKYQYGDGCLSDGVIGAWMARLYGIPAPLNTEPIRAHLAAVFRYNFRSDLRRHACLQRPGYALGREAGLLLCSFPRGNELRFPFPYSDEVWTGIEYQVAGHCLMEGLIEEALTIVEAARSRYDGRVRNPFNEYECGNFYARALSSYGLLQAYTGFRYDAVEQRLEIAPVVAKRPFRTFFATETAWGTLTLTDRSLKIAPVQGELAVQSAVIDGVSIHSGGTATPRKPLMLPRG